MYNKMGSYILCKVVGHMSQLWTQCYCIYSGVKVRFSPVFSTLRENQEPDCRSGSVRLLERKTER